MSRFNFLEHETTIETAPPTEVHAMTDGMERRFNKEQLAAFFSELQQNKDSFQAELVDRKTHFVLNISCRSLTCGPYEAKFPMVRTTLRIPKNKQLFYAVMDGVQQLPQQASIDQNSKGRAHLHIIKYVEDKKTADLRASVTDPSLKLAHQITVESSRSIAALLVSRTVANEMMKKEPVMTANAPEEQVASTPTFDQVIHETPPVVQNRVQEAKAIGEFRTAIKMVSGVVAGKAEQPKHTFAGLGNAFLTFLVQGAKSFFVQKRINVPALATAQRQIEAKILPWFRGPKEAVAVAVRSLWGQVHALFAQAAEKGLNTDRDTFFRQLDGLRQAQRAASSYVPSAGMPIQRKEALPPAMPRPKKEPPLELFPSKPTLGEKVTQGLQRLQRWGKSLFVAPPSHSHANKAQREKSHPLYV